MTISTKKQQAARVRTTRVRTPRSNTDIVNSAGAPSNLPASR